MRSRLLLSRISFRRQIILLGVVAVALLLGVLAATFAALQYTKSAVLKDEQRGLRQVSSRLAREYESKTATGQLPSRGKPGSENSREALTGLSQTMVQNADGIAGGFYVPGEDSLVGYASVTGAGSGPDGGGIPADERSSILEVAREAFSSQAAVQKISTAGHDVLLLDAVPIHDGQRDTGSAWSVQRQASIPGTNRFRAYVIAVGLGIAALACVILTLLVVQGLQSGVRKIEGGLSGLEQNLGSQILIEDDPQEIRQIAAAINRLGMTLRERIESEKLIEDRLQHAERLAALGRLIAGVAHEVRNPLATIRLRVQMCQQDSQSSEVRASCAVALEEIERMDSMVNRLLSFSRPVRLNSEPTNLHQLVEQRLGNFHDQARCKNVRFITEFSATPKVVNVDQNRMSQVFDNIIQNSLEAMSRSGGTLSVKVRSEPAFPAGSQDVCLEFIDTGEGISSKTAERIFDLFFTTKPTGTGLGLSICHELIEAHGGNIKVLGAEGFGTTVRILLPAGNGQMKSRLRPTG